MQRECLMAATALLLLSAGCVELDLLITINDDGSATVTETVRLTEPVLDMAATLPANEGLEVLLKRPRAEERVKLMGRGAVLVSHEVRDLLGGAKECVTVYSIPEVNDLRLCSMAVAHEDYEKWPMRLIHAPHYTDGSGYNIGTMTVHVTTPRQRGNWARPDGLKPDPPALSPADLQKYRDILPVFKDLMSGFRVSCRIDCYSPVGWATSRRAREMTREYVLLEFNDKNLDQYGTPILDNEEFILALVRWDVRSPHILNVVQHLASNLTVPVWLPHRGMSMPSFGNDRYLALPPSKSLFDKYFKGKPRYYGGDLEVPRPPNIHAREELIKWGIIRDPAGSP